MNGLTAIGSRIAEINAQLARLSAPAATTSTVASRPSSSATAGTASSFDDVLAGAVRSGAQARGSTSTTQTPYDGTSGTPATFTASRAAVRSAATLSTGATAPTTSTGRLTSSGAPVELARYGNGRIPAPALESIGGGHRLWAPAAEAFTRLQAAAMRDGVHIGVTDSYRSYAEQVDVARRKGLHSQGGLAAKPGTSEHGWGKSLDLALGAVAQRWMRAHADDYGFTENVSREPWHWTYAAR